jgi:S-DNA-T family DNA segregation ATPase FtsK/SpoIIIE
MINSLILSLLYRNSPSELKFIMVDQKRVELTPYNSIPHLLTPVITEVDKTLSALKWTVAEMERRYKLFEEVSSKGIADYNHSNSKDAMPYIVVLIDELNELMMVAGKDLEALVVRLAQMGRAAGVHLVLSTQRPDVNVITGLIKANVPARIALTTTSQVDSRTIIDQAGAEKLLGSGDLLFLSPQYIKPKRVQGVYLSDKEVKSVNDFIRKQRQPDYNEEVIAQTVRIGHGAVSLESADDDMFEEAAEVVIQSGKASASLLQRRLRIGYARAARLIDLLEERGIVGPADGARPREVLVSNTAGQAEEISDEYE